MGQLAGLAPPLTPSAIRFSAISFAAAMLALWIAFSLGLPRPFWAIITTYIVSQPLAGAAASKAVFRLIGTVTGAAAAVVMVPALANARPLLCLALACWVGACLFVALLDRTPRSYAAMLAGYTAAIIGFPCVVQPETVFDTAVSRVVEIGLGVVTATLLHILVFPKPVRAVIRDRAAAWLADADRWALDLLRAGGKAAARHDRRHLAAAAIEIHLLSIHLPFDTSGIRETAATVRALYEQMLLLIPTLSGVADRLSVLAHERPHEPLPPAGRAACEDVARWIEAGAPHAAAAALVDRLQVLARETSGDDWPGLITETLYKRLLETTRLLAQAHALLAHLKSPHAPVPEDARAAMAQARVRPLHRDVPLALWSGLTAAAAILVACVLWIVLGWPEGAEAATFVAIFMCFFAAIDDPAPSIRNFGLFVLAGLPLAALYLFLILPRVDGFPLLVAAFAPCFLLLGLYGSDARRAGATAPLMIGFCGALAIQETYSADFAGFVNAGLPQAVALLIAIVVTRAMRSMGADASARRLLGRTWRSLAQLARSAAAPDPTALAARLVDPLSQLTPKLAELPPDGDLTGADVLRDLRVGINVANLQHVRGELDAEPRAELEAVLRGVGEHYADRRAGRATRARAELLVRIDRLLAELRLSHAPAEREGVAGLVGLRRGLYPDSPGFAGRPAS